MPLLSAGRFYQNKKDNWVC